MKRGVIQIIPLVLIGLFAITTLIVSNQIKQNTENRIKAKSCIPICESNTECGVNEECIIFSNPCNNYCSSTLKPTPTPPIIYKRCHGNGCIETTDPSGDVCESDSDCVVVEPSATPTYTCNSNGGTCIPDGENCGTPITATCPLRTFCCSNLIYSAPTPAPTPSPKYYVCNSNYQCVENENGSFESISSCQSECVRPTPPPGTDCGSNYSGASCVNNSITCIYNYGVSDCESGKKCSEDCFLPTPTPTPTPSPTPIPNCIDAGGTCIPTGESCPLSINGKCTGNTFCCNNEEPNPTPIATPSEKCEDNGGTCVPNGETCPQQLNFSCGARTFCCSNFEIQSTPSPTPKDNPFVLKDLILPPLANKLKDGSLCTYDSDCVSGICTNTGAASVCLPTNLTLSYVKLGDDCDTTPYNQMCDAGLSCIYNKCVTTPTKYYNSLGQELTYDYCLQNPSYSQCKDLMKEYYLMSMQLTQKDAQRLEAECKTNPNTKACQDYQKAKLILTAAYLGGSAIPIAGPFAAAAAADIWATASLGGTAGTLGTLANLPTAAYAYGGATLTTLPAWATTTIGVTTTALGWAGVAGGTSACINDPYSDACASYLAFLQGDPTALQDLAQGTDNYLAYGTQQVNNYLDKQINNIFPQQGYPYANPYYQGSDDFAWNYYLNYYGRPPSQLDIGLAIDQMYGPQRDLIAFAEGDPIKIGQLERQLNEDSIYTHLVTKDEGVLISKLPQDLSGKEIMDKIYYYRQNNMVPRSSESCPFAGICMPTYGTTYTNTVTRNDIALVSDTATTLKQYLLEDQINYQNIRVTGHEIGHAYDHYFGIKDWNTEFRQQMFNYQFNKKFGNYKDDLYTFSNRLMNNLNGNVTVKPSLQIPAWESTITK